MGPWQDCIWLAPRSKEITCFDRRRSAAPEYPPGGLPTALLTLPDHSRTREMQPNTSPKGVADECSPAR